MTADLGLSVGGEGASVVILLRLGGSLVRRLAVVATLALVAVSTAVLAVHSGPDKRTQEERDCTKEEVQHALGSETPAPEILLGAARSENKGVDGGDDQKNHPDERHNLSYLIVTFGHDDCSV